MCVCVCVPGHMGWHNFYAPRGPACRAQRHREQMKAAAVLACTRVRGASAYYNMTLVYTDRVYIYGETQSGRSRRVDSKEGLPIDDN